MTFSNNKKVLLTGYSGFLGRYIRARLVHEGFEVITIGRKNADISIDLSQGVPKLPGDIDYVVHAAGKAHMVPKTQSESSQFFDTNHKGTLHLLEGISRSESSVKSIVFISSVAVYGLTEGKNIDETAALSANDPYGKSKIMAEQAISEYCNLRNINCSILRLPLVAGKPAPGNLGAMIKAIKKGWYLSIGHANVKKSIVMAEDVASLIPRVFNKSGVYTLTDSHHPTFGELEKAISAELGKKAPLRIPQAVANILAKTGDLAGKRSPINSAKLKKIQSELTFSDSKAVNELGWKPMKVIDNIAKIIP